MKIVSEKISKQELKQIADQDNEFYVKAVVDIEQEIIAIGGELHADLERILLENGSSQENLWGINILLENDNSNRIEFDSMINIRPRLRNISRDVEDPKVREKIVGIVNNLIE